MSAELPRRTRSFWRLSVAPTARPALTVDLNVEVCVVGAGLGGLTVAQQLTKQGLRVAVIDAFEVGAGETGRTTAHIAVPDDRYAYIEHAFGRETARLVAGSFAAALDHIERTTTEEGIECDFRRVDGYLYSRANDGQGALDKEYRAAARAGVDVMQQARLPLGVFDAGPCLRFPRQGQFHPLKYLHGLARVIEERGGTLYHGTRALSVDEQGTRALVTTPNGVIHADAVVLATNTPFHERVAMHTKQIAYQTYAVGAYVPKGAIPSVLIWDDGDPYYYIRTTPVDDERDLLIVGGADHKTGHVRDSQFNYAEVEEWTRTHFPQVSEFDHRWSGEVMEPLDGLAYLGPSPGSRNVFIITGDSGNGMTHATIGGLLVSDLILGRQNPWLAIYDPARKPVKKAMQFVKEQTSIAAQYTDWLSGGDEDSVAAVARGEGALIRHGMKKLAVYRDESGALHALSAKCTHLGCVVHWNTTEKTWDCPCHGSRFNPDGEVVHGPAATPLAAVDEEEWRAIGGEAHRASSDRDSARP